MKNAEELLEKILSDGELFTLTYRKLTLVIERDGLRLGNLFVAQDIELDHLLFYEINGDNGIEPMVKVSDYCKDDYDRVTNKILFNRIAELLKKKEDEKKQREFERTIPKLIYLALSSAERAQAGKEEK